MKHSLACIAVAFVFCVAVADASDGAAIEEILRSQRPMYCWIVE